MEETIIPYELPYPRIWQPDSRRHITTLLGWRCSVDSAGYVASLGICPSLGRQRWMYPLPVIFTSSDHTFAGKPIRIEKDVRRMQRICTYVMAHYSHSISLDEIAVEAGMNRSAFCSYFKRCKGMTFSQFVTQYRLNTACELLKHSQKQVSEICYTVGFNDLPHFIRVFTNAMGISPSKYRKQFKTT